MKELLELPRQSVIIPEAMFDVWPEHRVASLLDVENRPALSRRVTENDQEKLLHWGFVEQITPDQILKVLQTKSLPNPETWSGLLKLWAFVVRKTRTSRSRKIDKCQLRLVPVQGKDVLYAANDAIRLGERKLLQSEADFEFLAAHLLVLDPNWPHYLAEQRRNADASDDEEATECVDAAFEILDDIGLERE